MIKFSELEKITDGNFLQFFQDHEIKNLEVDSRKAIRSEGTIFFAIAGERNDGHQYLPELYKSGVRLFVVEKEIDVNDFPEGNFFLVFSSIRCLQQLVTSHRKFFTIPVIGITGSNGKTIIKEWLNQLLSPDYHIVKNPGSYNSQIGVPLSVWAMQSYHGMGIFEAGISKPGEMERLQEIIRPTIGIFTNVGPAHDEGFQNIRQKVEEKLRLFVGSEIIIYCKDHEQVASVLERGPARSLLSWGNHSAADILIRHTQFHLSIKGMGEDFTLEIPFSDQASVENVSHAIALMLYLKYPPGIIKDRVMFLKTVPMRLQLKQGINHCQVIDDTYNNDLAGLQISLNFLAGMRKDKNTLILSDILQSGLDDSAWTEQVVNRLDRSVVSRFIGIGPGLKSNRSKFDKIDSRFYATTDEFLKNAVWDDFHEETILVKGARPFQFEKIVSHLQKKIHGTIMEIDLNAMVHNLNLFKSILNPGVKLMVMVKAFAYGSGSAEVTSLLQYHNVDYLGVAYPDEGIELRKNHIHLPVLVMNPSEESFATLLEYNLEPEIYSPVLLQSWVKFLNGRPGAMHLKLDTGMHRLGFESKDLNEVITTLKKNKNITVRSIFSHLAGADDPVHDMFTRGQGDTFLLMADQIKNELGIEPLLHILNSAGILRFPELQMGMVRLGIGLYGVSPIAGEFKDLKPVATLKTIISQIKTIASGQSVGYGRQGRADGIRTIATIAIGYADGFSRSFSGGRGLVFVGGHLAPVIGNVCMDMCMIDVTGIQVKEGDEVIIFGGPLPIQDVAARSGTIPYEILTSTSERVKRVFFTESI